MQALAIATVAAIFACAVPAFARNVRPDAGFGFFSRDPVSGEIVRFVSYACDPDGKLAEQAWDLDNDGLFDDAFGRNVFRSFPAGEHRVRLRVTDQRGLTATRARTVDVDPKPDYALPPLPFDPPLLSPFPMVRITGSVSGARTRIRVLAVRAPVCSKATVVCKGPGCRRRRATKWTRRGPTRFPTVERRLGAGATIKVLVTKRDRIGRLTRFRIRADRPPKRTDRCLEFGKTRGIVCPAAD
jgi:hypothetical protein